MAWFPTLLFMAAAGSAPPAQNGQNVSTLTGMLAGYEAIMKRNDTDRDGRLSRGEWAVMVRRTFPNRSGRDNDLRLRQRGMHEFDVENVDRDGFLTMAEILRMPMAVFACMDTNHDDVISPAEGRASVDACSTLDKRPTRRR